MRKLNSIAMASVSLAALSAQYAFAVDPQTVSCTVEFELDSANFNAQELNDCMGKINQDNLKLLHIVTSATPPGSTEHNSALTEARASKIKTDLAARFPNVQIMTVGAGESAKLGKTAQILAVEIMEQPQQAQAPVEVVPEPSQGASVTAVTTTLTATPERAARIAARVGRDRYNAPIGEMEKNFVSAGAEIAWLPQVTASPFGAPMRGEVGLTGSAMNDENWVDAAAVHGFAGPAIRMDTFVVGARALVGGTWDRTSKWRPDGGGELRLGYEGNDLSIFAGVGQTTQVTRVGIDLGVLL